MPQLLPRFSARAQRVEDAQRVARIVLESGEAPPELRPGAGMHADRDRLRGIPVVGGAAGTQPRTDPVAEVLRRERQGAGERHRT